MSAFPASPCLHEPVGMGWSSPIFVLLALIAALSAPNALIAAWQLQLKYWGVLQYLRISSCSFPSQLLCLQTWGLGRIGGLGALPNKAGTRVRGRLCMVPRTRHL